MATRSSWQAGFSLIEILVTLTILAIILSIGLPRAQMALLTSRVEQAIPYLLTVGSLERAYQDSHGEYFQPATDDEQELIDTLGVQLKDSGDFCYVVRTSGFISSSTHPTPEFEVWAILRDNLYSGGAPGRDQTAGVSGTDVAGCLTATDKVHAGGWVQSEESAYGGEGKVVVYRYPPPPAEMDSAFRTGRSITLLWQQGISITDPLL